MKIHGAPHPAQGRSVTLGAHASDSINMLVVPGATFFVRGWWDSIRNTSWKNETSDSLALSYALRRTWEGLPDDDDVLVGEIAGQSVVVHASEINGIAQPALVGV